MPPSTIGWKLQRLLDASFRPVGHLLHERNLLGHLHALLIDCAVPHRRALLSSRVLTRFLISGGCTVQYSSPPPPFSSHYNTLAVTCTCTVLQAFVLPVSLVDTTRDALRFELLWIMIRYRYQHTISVQYCTVLLFVLLLSRCYLFFPHNLFFYSLLMHSNSHRHQFPFWDSISIIKPPAESGGFCYRRNLEIDNTPHSNRTRSIPHFPLHIFRETLSSWESNCHFVGHFDIEKETLASADSIANRIENVPLMCSTDISSSACEPLASSLFLHMTLTFVIHFIILVIIIIPTRYSQVTRFVWPVRFFIPYLFLEFNEKWSLAIAVCEVRGFKYTTFKNLFILFLGLIFLCSVQYNQDNYVLAFWYFCFFFYPYLCAVIKSPENSLR